MPTHELIHAWLLLLFEDASSNETPLRRVALFGLFLAVGKAFVVPDPLRRQLQVRAASIDLEAVKRPFEGRIEPPHPMVPQRIVAEAVDRIGGDVQVL